MRLSGSNGDAGNDEIAELAFKNGTAAQLPFKWTFPNLSLIHIYFMTIQENFC